MATTLPSLTRTIDDAFTHTWYEIRAAAQDNILDKIVVWAALRQRGRFMPQVGGEFISRTIRYGTKSATAIAKGSTLSTGEDDIETMARWDWRYLASHAQRSLIDDQKNAGKFRIKSLVGTKLGAARDALEQKFETQILGTHVSAEGGNEMEGLNDMVPDNGDRAAGTYGKINRPTTFASDAATVGNTWWTPRYKVATQPEEVMMVSDMRNIYNTISNASSRAPNLILTTQTYHELYEDMAGDTIQIVKGGGGLADLAFDVLRFKGKEMVWSANMTAGNMMMLNTDFIEVVYDPNLWFQMSEWKPIYNQTERIAHFFAVAQVISDHLRAHGLLYNLDA